MKFKPALLVTSKYLLGIALLYLVFKLGTGFDFSLLKPILNWKFIALIVFCKLTAFTLTVLRWQMILNALDIKLAFKKLYSLGLVGVATSYVMPGAISGDIIKTVFLQKTVKDLRKISVSVIFDRVFGLFSVLFLLILSGSVLFNTHPEAVEKVLALVPKSNLLVAGLVVSLFVGGIFVIYRMNKKIYSKLKEPLREVHLIRGKMVLLTALSCLSQCILIACYFIFYNVMGQEPLGVLPITFVFCFAGMSAVLPLTPGGLGVGQMVFNFVLSLFLTQPTSIGATLFTIFQVFDLMFIIPGVLLVFWEMIGRGNKKVLIPAER